MPQKTVTDIEGVYASAASCGIKPGRNDLAYLYVPQAYAAAGVFTRNKFRAACIEHTAACLAKGTLKALVVNSGNANAVTGDQGLVNAGRTAALAASLLGLQQNEVAVASTGIIGRQLPMGKIEEGLRRLLASPHLRHGQLAAEAIMTTDTRPKQVYLQREIAGRIITVAGMAKGSGMIAPNMGTMLAFLATDAKIVHSGLQSSLVSAVDESFNMTSVDTDTSTNDMALLFATGAQAIPGDGAVCAEFTALLTEACITLAKMIAADGEGATKLIEVALHGALNKEQARQLALNIINSPLFKAAVHGADPNWGRVLAALGKNPALDVRPERVDLFFGSQQILSKGEILDYNVDAVRKILSRAEISIIVDLNLGDASARAWGCDLTKEYVEINTSYN